MARLYGSRAENVAKIIEFDPPYAIEVTLRRPLGSGAVGETDVYGAQQHVPLMPHAIEWEDCTASSVESMAGASAPPAG